MIAYHWPFYLHRGARMTALVRCPQAAAGEAKSPDSHGLAAASRFNLHVVQTHYCRIRLARGYEPRTFNATQ